MDETYAIEVGVDDSRREAVTDGLIGYNDSHSDALAAARRAPDWGRTPIEAYAVEDGQVIGGITGHTVWNWLKIDILWIDERHRGRGVGSRLLETLEAEAIQRGCTRAKLSTFSFQAPRFYPKHGYDVAGLIEGHPPGANDYTFVKDLT